MAESIRSTPNKSIKQSFTYNEVNVRKQSIFQMPNQIQNEQNPKFQAQQTTHKKQSASINLQNTILEKSSNQGTFEEFNFDKSKLEDKERFVQFTMLESQDRKKGLRDSCNEQKKFIFEVINENKIDSFIKENSILHLDNEKLAKLAHQKKTEAELWKQKYENQLSQFIQQVKANYEQEIRYLQSGNESLMSKQEQTQFDRQLQALQNQVINNCQDNKQINKQKKEIESLNQKSLDDATKNYSQQIEALHDQIFQLKEYLQEKGIEVDELNEKLLRIKKEGNYSVIGLSGLDDEEVKRVLKENENLRNKLNLLEIEKQQELEELTRNINFFQEEQLQNFKVSQSNQNLMIEAEVDKLRSLLDIKNTEIQTLIVQNQKIKNCFEEDLESQRREIALLKQKLLDQEKQCRRKLEMLSTDLNSMQQEDIDRLRINYENQIYLLEKELNDLNEKINKQDYEFQEQLNEKQSLQQYLENQVYCLKSEIEQKQLRVSAFKCLELEREKNKEIDELQSQFMKNQSLMNDNSDSLRNQIILLENEIIKLKDMNNQKNKDLDQIRQENLQTRKLLEDELNSLCLINQTLKEEIINCERNKDSELEAMKTRINRVELQMREKMRQLEICCEHQGFEIKRLKEHLEVKGQEIDNLLVQRSQLERELRRVKDELEQGKTKIIQLEREQVVFQTVNIIFSFKLQSQDELKIRLENSAQNQIQNLKAVCNSQIQLLEDENNNLRSQIERKNQDIDDLMDKQVSQYSNENRADKQSRMSMIYQGSNIKQNIRSSISRQQ